MTSKTESSRRVRRPLIKATKGMVAMTFLGGCRLWYTGPTEDGSYGGRGGDGSTSTSSGGGTAGAAGAGGEGGAGGGGQLGGGGSAPCSMTCVEALDALGDTGTPLCETAPQMSLELYKAFMDCTCLRVSTEMVPGCADLTLCHDNLCIGAQPSADCAQCIQTGACMNEFNACAADG